MGLPTRLTCLTCFLLFFVTYSQAQTILSGGVFTGFTLPLTFDQGINKDSRFQGRYDVKWAPIGFNFDIDLEGYSLMTNPSVATFGQNFYILNTVGGQVGIRRINLTSVQIPVGVKLHLIDLSFFRVSFVGSLAAGFLLKGSETITHRESKLLFPTAVLPSLPPDYVAEYDGVIVPSMKGKEIAGKDSFNQVQLFIATGVRGDWDIADHMRLSLDLRFNYGVLDPRNSSYLQKIRSNQSIYDIKGWRRDVFVSFTLGVARINELDTKGSKYKKYHYGPNRRKPRKGS